MSTSTAIAPRSGTELATSIVTLSVSKAARIARHVRRGASITVATAAAGVPRQTFYTWSHAARDGHWPTGELVSPDHRWLAARLIHAVERAQALNEARLQANMLQAARMKVGDRDWRAGHEYLKHQEGSRRRWHEFREVQMSHSGWIDVRAYREVEAMPEAEVLDLAGDEWRELLEPA